MTIGFDRLEAFATGDRSEDATILEGFRAALKFYYNEAGTVPIEQCLGLPSRRARNGFAVAERDFWLRAAACQIDAAGGIGRQLAEAVERFLSRTWPSWKNYVEPPEDASRLNTCLFKAARACGGELPTSDDQLGRIIAPVLKGANPWHLREAARGGALDWDIRRMWAESELLGLEFGSFEAFRAYHAAVASGKVRVYLSEAVRLADKHGD